MNKKEIEELIKFVSKAGVSEVSLEQKDFKITIKNSQRLVEYVAAPAAPIVHAAPLAAAPVAATAPAASAPASAPADAGKGRFASTMARLRAAQAEKRRREEEAAKASAGSAEA